MNPSEIIECQKSHPYQNSTNIQWRELRSWLVYAVANDSPHLLEDYIAQASTKYNLCPEDIISHGIATYNVPQKQEFDIYYQNTLAAEVQFSLWDIAGIHGSTKILPNIQKWFPLKELINTPPQKQRTVWLLGTKHYKPMTLADNIPYITAYKVTPPNQAKALANTICAWHKAGIPILDIGNAIIELPNCGSTLQQLTKELPAWPDMIRPPTVKAHSAGFPANPKSVYNGIEFAEQCDKWQKLPLGAPTAILRVLFEVLEKAPENYELLPHAIIRNNINTEDLIKYGTKNGALKRNSNLLPTIEKLGKCVDDINHANKTLQTTVELEELSMF